MTGPPHAAPEPRCLICGSTRLRPRLRKQALALVACADCGFVQQHPVPAVDAALDAYEHEAAYADGLLRSESEFARREQQLLEQLAGLGARGPLLDVGAAAGLILAAARARGWEPVGIEVSRPAAARLRGAQALEIHEQLIESATLAAGRFGTVIFSHSLEHLVDPVGALRRARELLAPGGLVHVAVPNWNSCKRLLAGREVPWIYPHHISYFTRRSLGRALQDAGLTVVAAEQRGWPGRDYAFVLAWLRATRLDRALRAFLHLGEQPLESLLADNLQLRCPPWRLRAVLLPVHALLGGWPERALCAAGLGDELRLTARKD